MPATPISTVSRYIPEGTWHFNYLPAVATLASPTRAEINAGTDLSPQVAGYGTWAITSNPVSTPDLASTFVPSIPGLLTIDGTTLSMYADPAGSDARTLLPRNTVGFILVLPGGDVAGRRMNAVPVKVQTSSPSSSIGGNPSTIELSFTATAAPVENITIPA
jgi:hypothetical protein